MEKEIIDLFVMCDGAEDVTRAAAIHAFGKKYFLHLPRKMLDDNWRLREQNEKNVLTDALKQVVRKECPDRKYVEIEYRFDGSTDDQRQHELDVSIWSNRRKHYEQIFFIFVYL